MIEGKTSPCLQPVSDPSDMEASVQTLQGACELQAWLDILPGFRVTPSALGNAVHQLPYRQSLVQLLVQSVSGLWNLKGVSRQSKQLRCTRWQHRLL